MVILMKVCLKIVKKMDKEFINFKTAQFLKEVLKEIKLLVLVKLFLLMVIHMKVILLII